MQIGKGVLLWQVLSAILKSVWFIWLLVVRSSICRNTASNSGEGRNEKRPHLAYYLEYNVY